MKENNLKILVIGEECTDKFVYCKVNRLSPEAPVPVLIPVKTTKNSGMAGNVVANLKALEPTYITMLMAQTEVITKTRYVEEKSNHMFFRLDEGEETINPIRWSKDFETILKDADLVIVSDYNKGFLDTTSLWNIGHLAKLSILDTKRKLTPDVANKFSFIKLNESESKNNKHLDPKNIIVTLGSKGAYYNGELIPQPNPQQTIDVSGAGDTFVAAFALKFLETLEERIAIEYANEMAGIVVSQRGVVTPL
jgi:D-beta-D-heptose 7-phosphate kinase/D-beta-D-heptose 1-phosphate adenosyltransferase